MYKKSRNILSNVQMLHLSYCNTKAKKIKKIIVKILVVCNWK